MNDFNTIEFCFTVRLKDKVVGAGYTTFDSNEMPLFPKEVINRILVENRNNPRTRTSVYSMRDLDYQDSIDIGYGAEFYGAMYDGETALWEDLRIGLQLGRYHIQFDEMISFEAYEETNFVGISYMSTKLLKRVFGWSEYVKTVEVRKLKLIQLMESL